MKRSYKLMFLLALVLGLGAAGAYAQKGGRLTRKFNKAARGTLLQKFNYYRSKSGDRTGAAGRSLNLLKPRFETRGPNTGRKPNGPKP